MKPSTKTCASCGEAYTSDVLFCPKDGTPLGSGRNGSIPGNERDPYLDMELPGQIKLEHLVGIGSMGRVYRAFQGGIERAVAVKVLHRELSSNAELVGRFHREAKIASRLVHPNVVQVLLEGALPFSANPHVGGELYLVMEYLDGISLLSALAAAGANGEGDALPLSRALHIALQICDAVGEAHQQSITHRDLKPENIMLVRRGEDHDFVKVLDFGIARLDWADKSMATQAGRIFGTAKYISPEGAEGLPVGPPSDVYAIATVLYQCLAGRTPFEGDSPVALLVQHSHAPPTDLRSIARASYVPAPIAQVVMKNLAKKPQDRAPNARELGRELLAAARASGLAPETLGRQSGLAQGGQILQLSSKERTKNLDLSPELASRIGGVPAAAAQTSPTVEPTLDDHTDEPGSPRSGPSRAGTTVYAEPLASGSGDSSPPRPDLDEARASGPDAMEAELLSTMQGHEAPLSSPPPGVPGGWSGRGARARVVRLAGVGLLAAAVGLVLVVGGRRLASNDSAAAGASLDDTLAAAREAMRRRQWTGPDHTNVKALTDDALERFPDDERVRELRREAAERIITDALGHKYAGKLGEALSLARLALELEPELTTARHLVRELEQSAGGRQGLPDVTPTEDAARVTPAKPGRASISPPLAGASASAAASAGPIDPQAAGPAASGPAVEEPPPGAPAALPPTPPALPDDHQPSQGGEPWL